MDFVDLDKVLDEFEEEEKQALSIVPGQELKPSGYIEFLEKHQEQEWASLNPNKFSSTSGYTLERRSTREPVNVAYDEPYDSFSSSKLGFISTSDSVSQNGYDSRAPEGKMRGSQSAIVTNLTRVNVNGESVNSVYTSKNNPEFKGIANSSERKGTIAYQPKEVQTDALSPASEEELMSSPFPRSDIIVDGHGDTTVSSETNNETDQNHSPIYASMDADNLDVSNGTSSQQSSTPYASFVNENENQTQPTAFSTPNVTDSAVNSDIQPDYHSSTANSDIAGNGFDVSEPVVGFHDPGEDDIDDSEITMYLNKLDEGVVSDFNAAKATSELASGQAEPQHPGAPIPDIQSDLNRVRDSKTRSLADELDEAEPEVDHYSLSHSESLPKKFRSDISETESNGLAHHQDPDLVADLGHHPQVESHPQTSQLGEAERSIDVCQASDSQAVYNSFVNGKMEIEHILDKTKQDNQRDAMYSSLMNEKMEIENILDDKGRAVSVGGIGDSILRGKMEIESILDEVIQNQQNMVKHDLHPEQPLDKHMVSSSLNQPDVTQGSDPTRGLTAEGLAHDMSPSSRDTNSISPVHSGSSYNSETGSPVLSMGVGARPKDPSMIKKNRPNSLLGLSKVNLDLPAVVKTTDGNGEVTPPQLRTTNTDAARNSSQFPDVTAQSQESTVRQQQQLPEGLDLDHQTVNESRQRMINVTSTGEPGAKPVIHDFSQSGNQSLHGNGSDQHPSVKRPTSLNLPARQDFSMRATHEEDMEPDDNSVSPNSTDQPEGGDGSEEGATGVRSSLGAESDEFSNVPPSPIIHSNLGLEAPFWIPDADAESCMICQTKFTMWKRRHHCRACGKVLCSGCCSQKALLPYMDNKEARVCVECHIQLNLAAGAGSTPRCPNPNNPNEYCSKVPPNQQASSHANPPVVMVPTGVLKTSGSQRRSGEPKQVMFSDGIRPGGDLTELDGPDQARPSRRSARASRRAAQQQQQGSPPARKIKEDSVNRSPCLVPEEGLPPLFILQDDTGYVETDEALNQIDYTADYKSEGEPLISFAVNKNLSVGVKIINLDCCVNRVSWCFVTRGMNTAGQSEVVILLELTEEELASESVVPPRDIFQHFHMIYEEALKGNPIQDMGHSIFHQNFLGNREHGGFLFLRPTFQCLNKLPLPESPYLFGILLQKWEVPWAKVFPIRLLLRLGAEYRYYPCPLVGVRNRKPVFFEIGHTIINLLADFRNYQYMLSQIKGVTIHMENKKTVISFPRNRYNDVMKVVRNSNEHVMALGSSFSSEADSHLVCIQNEDGNYQTQAINIQNKPRLVTGSSFVVFNGALKTSSGLRAKSSIVEDGLMVQVLPEAMASIKDALKEMTDHTILCGPVDAADPEEMVELRWVDNDKNFNVGVKSYIDDSPLDGIESVSVKCPSDFLGETLAIRWTRVYFLQHEDSPTSHFDPMDLSRLTEDIAQACCTALIKHLDELKKDGLVKLGLRVNLTRDAVGYEIGSKGQSLPAAMINNLDTFLVPIVHQASEEGVIMELVFNIVE